jgi:hypothetical protein
MATLKCLACGHDNKVGDESCSSCSSSLNLKLCSACEAINAHSAERCHGCNADFRAEAEAAALEAEPRPRDLHEAPFVYKTLPAAWRAAAQEARKRSTRVTVGLWLLPLLALGLGYYSYVALQKSDTVPAAQAARESRMPAKAEAAPREIARPEELARPQQVVRPQQVEVRQTPAPAVSGKLSSPKTAPAPLARNTPVPEPKRATSVVTHTRAGAAALPVAAAAPLPAASATAALSQPVATPVSEPAATAERRHAPVTHTKAILTETKATLTETKATLTEAAAATTVPAAASEGRSVQAETRSDEPAGCAPAVVALGLCKSK